MKSYRQLKMQLWLFMLTAMIPSSGAFAQTETLSLEDAIRIARAQNRNLRADSAGIAQAVEQTRIARSFLLPSVSLTGQYQHYFQRPVFFGLNGEVAKGERIDYARFGGEDLAGAQVSLVQPIYHAGAKHEMLRSRLLEQKSRTGYQDREVQVVAGVRQTYVLLLVLTERLRLQQESISRNQRALTDARLLLAQGKGLRVDTLRAYTTVRNLQPDLLRLNNAIEVGQQRLNALLGRDVTTRYALSDSLGYVADEAVPSEETVFRTAVQQRPDLRRLDLDKALADRQVLVAQAARTPVVNFVSQYQLNTQTNDFRFGRAGYPSVFFTGIQFAIPLFSGMQHVARVSQAKLRRVQADDIYIQALEDVRNDVKQIYAAIDETSERIKTQQTVSETAALSYSITKYRYEKGVASRLELVDAEFALTTARSNYLEAIYDYLSARIELDRTMGVVEP